MTQFDVRNAATVYGQVNGDNYGDNYFIAAVKKIKPLNVVIQEELAQLEHAFHQPDGLADATIFLSQSTNSLLVLTGTAGSGRTTAAVKILDSLGLRIRRLSIDSDDDLILDPEIIADRDGLLLDLTMEPQELEFRVNNELGGFVDQLAAKSAKLIVIPARGNSSVLAHPLITHAIGRPDGRKVLEKRLRARGLDVPLTDENRELVRLLDSDSMADIVTFAEQVIGNARTDPYGKDGWIADALTATSLSTQQFETHQDVATRALLLTVALLEECTTDQIYAAERKLHERLIAPSPEPATFATQGITERLHLIEALTNIEQRVHFRQSWLGSAVLAQALQDFPAERTAIVEWAVTLSRSSIVSYEQANEAMRKLVVACFRVGQHQQLLALLDRVTRHPDTISLPAASEILQAGLTHPRYGRDFRRRIRELAANPALPVASARLFVRICVAVIAPQFPEQATVRLHHLARNDDSLVREEAITALLEITARTSTYRHALLRIVERTTFGGPLLDLDLAVFAALAGPEHALMDNIVRWQEIRNAITVMWTRCLARGLSTVTSATAGRWLVGPPVLREILLDATENNPEHLSELFAVTLRWLRHDAATFTEFRTSIHHALRAAEGNPNDPII